MRLFRSAAVAVMLLIWTTDALAVELSGKKARLINTDRQEVGEVTFSETPNGVLIRLDLHSRPAKISPGVHAVHLHEVGQCDPPFKSAGAHLNATGKKHGFFSKDGAHIGDLPNLHVPKEGPLRVEMMVPQASLSGGRINLIDADGLALVIHQGADDYKSDPAGDSGDRIACAAIEGSRSAK